MTTTVPATSANLGPGFDALGLALGLRDRVEAEVAGDGLRVEVSGEGSGTLALDETHLVVRAMTAGFAALGVERPGLRVHCHNLVPHGRGLGSSSAAIVAGLVTARALVAEPGGGLPDDALLALAAGLEGHPDNVAPALLGGATVAWTEPTGARAVRVAVDPRVRAVAFVPPGAVLTELARGLLPHAVPHGEAAANAGRAALLVAALGQRPDLLLPATRDWLHQDHREQAMPDSLALVRRLREEQVAAFVSGAGPTVLALVAEPGAEMSAVLEDATPAGWRRLDLAVDLEGATVSHG